MGGKRCSYESVTLKCIKFVDAEEKKHTHTHTIEREIKALQVLCVISKSDPYIVGEKKKSEPITYTVGHAWGMTIKSPEGMNK